MQSHRRDEVNRFILPCCLPVMEAIGYRITYDAAVAQSVRPALVNLYVVNVAKLDTAWYAENTPELGRAAQEDMETRRVDAVFPILGDLVQGTDILAYVGAPP